MKIEQQLNQLIQTVQTLVEQLDREKEEAIPDLLDNADFIQLMKISSRTAGNWRERGKIKYCKLGNKIYYRREDIMEMIQDGYAECRHFRHIRGNIFRYFDEDIIGEE